MELKRKIEAQKKSRDFGSKKTHDNPKMAD